MMLRMAMAAAVMVVVTNGELSPITRPQSGIRVTFFVQCHKIIKLNYKGYSKHKMIMLFLALHLHKLSEFHFMRKTGSSRRGTGLHKTGTGT